jgi:hypothetical protein
VLSELLNSLLERLLQSAVGSNRRRLWRSCPVPVFGFEGKVLTIATLEVSLLGKEKQMIKICLFTVDCKTASMS